MIERIVVGVIMMFGFSFTLWLIKRSLSRIEKMVGIIEEKRQSCREELPVKYAEKDSVERLWKRTDDHEKDIEYAKGLRNGVKA